MPPRPPLGPSTHLGQGRGGQGNVGVHVCPGTYVCAQAPAHMCTPVHAMQLVPVRVRVREGRGGVGARRCPQGPSPWRALWRVGAGGEGRGYSRARRAGGRAGGGGAVMLQNVPAPQRPRHHFRFRALAPPTPPTSSAKSGARGLTGHCPLRRGGAATAGSRAPRHVPGDSHAHACTLLYTHNVRVHEHTQHADGHTHTPLYTHTTYVCTCTHNVQTVTHARTSCYTRTTHACTCTHSVQTDTHTRNSHPPTYPVTHTHTTYVCTGNIQTLSPTQTCTPSHTGACTPMHNERTSCHTPTHPTRVCTHNTHLGTPT